MTALSTAYDSTFGAIGFYDLFDGSYSSGDYEVAEDYTVHKIPGSDNNIVFTGGAKVKELQLSAGVMESELGSLRSAVNTSATLIYHGGTVTARLMAVRDAKKATGHDAYKCTMVFIIS